MPHRALLVQIRAEFVEMPGLRLTPAQVHRLCGGERPACERALGTLVDEGFLVLRSGRYVRSVDGEVQHHGHQHVHGAA